MDNPICFLLVLILLVLTVTVIARAKKRISHKSGTTSYEYDEENESYKSWICAHSTGYYGSIDYYHCNIIETGFDKWIEENV